MQPTQTLLFKKETPENTPTNEYKAYSALWEFFFQEHGLMLLNGQMDDILREVDKFKSTFNQLKQKNEEVY